jgi:N-acetylneuraminate synthase
MYGKPVAIAEIGCNHQGSLETAKKMVQIAADFCNADVIKFQKRTPSEILTEEEYNSPHPVPSNSYGETYGLHREYLELDLTQHKQLMEECEKYGKVYSCSVWDLSSARDICSLNPEIIKIPSACSNYFKLIDYLCGNFGGEIHLSIGMTTPSEIEEIVKYFQKKQRNKDLVLYHCTSGYPISFEDACLLHIKMLREKYGDTVKDIGFSGHHLGIAIDIAAYTLGAKYIERHFTLDRTWKGTDHAASLEPDGLRKLVRNLNAAHSALKYKAKDLLDVEIEQKKKLRWNRNQQ